MPENLADSTKLDAQYRTMLTLWAAFLGTIVMYLFLTFILRQEEGDSNQLLTVIFSAVSVFMVGLSFVVKRRFFTRAVDEQQPRLVNSGFIFAGALCEVAALLGLLDLMIAHDRYFFLLIGIALLGLVLHFPKRSDLEAASYKKIG